MTLSPKDRQKNFTSTVAKMMGELRDRAIDVTLFDPQSEPFRETYPTTWDDLRRRGWVEPIDEKFRLTGKGWLEGVRSMDTHKHSSFVDRLRVLVRTLKRYIDNQGRTKDACVDMAKVAQDSNLPEGWVFNAIDSNALPLLSGTLQDTGPRWYERGRLVLIPLSFNIEAVDIPVDFETALERVKDGLVYVEEQLSEYRCGFCGAPLSERVQVELSEDDYGTAESYECGYQLLDGSTEHPCPSDPGFPQLNEYEFHFTENEREPVLKWNCYAKPKTESARQLSLKPGLGKTRDEAKQQVIQWYELYKRPWKG